MKIIKLLSGDEALVDDEDYQYLNEHKWSLKKNISAKYAVRHKVINGKQKTISMHREILGIIDMDIIVDHKDFNGLNNQKGNLRPCNKQQSQCNRRSFTGASSSFKGVSWKKGYSKWQAHIRSFGKLKWLGSFNTEKEAALAYNHAAVSIHGEFAHLNKID